MQNRQVTRLCALAQRLDELHKALHEVPYLEGEVIQKREFAEIVELGKTAQASLARTRGNIARKTGPTVARGWK